MSPRQAMQSVPSQMWAAFAGVLIVAMLGAVGVTSMVPLRHAELESRVTSMESTRWTREDAIEQQREFKVEIRAAVNALDSKMDAVQIQIASLVALVGSINRLQDEVDTLRREIVELRRINAAMRVTK